MFRYYHKSGQKAVCGRYSIPEVKMDSDGTVVGGGLVSSISIPVIDVFVKEGLYCRQEYDPEFAIDKGRPTASQIKIDSKADLYKAEDPSTLFTEPRSPSYGPYVQPDGATTENSFTENCSVSGLNLAQEDCKSNTYEAMQNDKAKFEAHGDKVDKEDAAFKIKEKTDAIAAADKLAAKAEAKSELKPEPKLESKPEAKAEAKSEVKTQSGSDVDPIHVVIDKATPMPEAALDSDKKKK